MQDFEFTIEEGKLYMLQTRNGKRTGPAAVRVAVEMVEEGMIEKKEAVLRVAPQQLDQLLHPVFDPASLQDSDEDRPPASRHRRARPWAAWRSLRKMRSRWRRSGPVILVRKETTPDDIHGMDVAKGILTAIGGKSSHAAVVARGMGRPCIVGAASIADRRSARRSARSMVGGKNHHRQGRRLDFARRHHRRSLSRPGEDQRADPKSHYLRQVHELGRRIPRQVRRARQCGYSARRQSGARCSAPKASACAAPSTCSSPKTASRTCRR